MSGFSNPIIGGGGALVYPSIHSPGFNVASPPASPTPSWGILKSGLAYFFGLAVTGGTITGPSYIINTAGAFYYSGTPAAGSLSASIVPGTANVADPFGNVALPGVTTYQTPLAVNSIATNTQAGSTTWFAWNGIGWGFGVTIDWTVPDNFLEVNGSAFRSIGGTSASPTLISTDSWTPFGSFGAGFSSGSPAVRQALLPVGAGGVAAIALAGEALTTAATAANSTICTLAQAPASAQSYVVPTNASGYAPGAGALPRVITVDTAGRVRLQPAANAANQFVILDGIIVWLG